MPKSRARANGEGTIFQRKGSTKWYVELVVGWGEDGKKRVLRHSADTRKECQQWLVERLKEKQSGTLTEPTRMKVSDFLKHWLDSTVARTCKPTTISNYSQVVRVHINPEIGGVEITKLTPMMVESLYTKVQQKGSSPRTVQLVHAVLRRALDQGLKWGIIARNPCDAVTAPKNPGREMKYLTPDEIDRFLEAAKADRLHAMFILAVTTGLRLGELSGLRWEDIDFEKGNLQVIQTVTQVNGRLLFGTPKSKSSRRTVPIPSIALAALKKWRVEQAQERLMLGDAWKHPELVFTTRRGGPLSATNIRTRMFPEVLRLAQCKKVRFHDLRHSYVVLSGLAGVSIGAISKNVGHSRQSITTDVYSHVLEEQRKEAATKLDSFLTARRKAR